MVQKRREGRVIVGGVCRVSGRASMVVALTACWIVVMLLLTRHQHWRYVVANDMRRISWDADCVWLVLDAIDSDRIGRQLLCSRSSNGIARSRPKHPMLKLLGRMLMSSGGRWRLFPSRSEPDGRHVFLTHVDRRSYSTKLARWHLVLQPTAKTTPT